MTSSQELFQENNNEKCKNTTAWLSKHEFYKALDGHNIKLWIGYKYHMPECINT